MRNPSRPRWKFQALVSCAVLTPLLASILTVNRNAMSGVPARQYWNERRAPPLSTGCNMAEQNKMLWKDSVNQNGYLECDRRF